VKVLIPEAVAALILAACSAGAATSTSGAVTDPTSPSATASTIAPSPGTPAEVIRIFDGDSLLVAINSEEVEVRLLGVNAPESSECHGAASRTALQQLLGSGDLRLVADTEETDQYGRLLRYLFVGGTNVNLALLAGGDAVAVQSGHTANAEFVAASDAAAAARLGMWAPDACGNQAPPAGVAIVGYDYDPPGPDGESINEEWVGIANQSGAPVDMGEWILRDESTQHRFSFPAGFSLAPDSEVAVRTGCGTDTSTDLFWCADGPVWSNAGDTVILELPDGTVVARDRYSGRS
jgi:micrococcal nuclease